MKTFLTALFVMLIAWPAWGQSLDFLRPVTTQTLEIHSSSSSITNSLGAYIRVVRLHPTEDAHVAIGASPLTATTDDLLVPADTTEYFLVAPNSYIAVIVSGTQGVIYVTSMSK